MVFTTIEFLIFLIVALLAFYSCPIKHRWKMLLIISIVFYMISGIQYLPFIFATSFLVFVAARIVTKNWSEQDQKIAREGVTTNEKKQLKKQYKRKNRRVLLAVLVITLGILSYSKFLKYFLEPINGLILALGGKGDFAITDIIVPLGISYYTFSTIGYLLDVYWRRYESESNYGRFALYAIYFPHILQGPIERYNRLGSRLKMELKYNSERILSGFQLMLWGYFKKLVIADRVNIYVTAAYANPSKTGGSLLLIAAFLDVLYIYMDFSGCMDIARGVSDMFGIELDINFKRPFFSKSITEFWRRWHMTLGGWFKDYVYYPVSTASWVKKTGKKVKKAWGERAGRIVVTFFPVVITWFLTGLWHGTGKTYIAWGLYYGFVIMCSVTFHPEMQWLTKKFNINTEATSWRVFQMVRTTCIFAVGRLLTRPGILYKTKVAIQSIVTDFQPYKLFDGSLYTYGVSEKEFHLLTLSIILLIYISNLQEKGSVRDMVQKQNIVFRYALLLGIIFAILILGIYGPGYSAGSFAYMNY